MPQFQTYPRVSAPKSGALTLIYQDGGVKTIDIENLVKVGALSSVADLKAVDTDGLINGSAYTVIGYYAAGDGGGGLFYYDPTSFDSDNGGTVIEPDSGNGRWLRVVQGRVTLKDFGALGDGSTDDTDSLQFCLDSGFPIFIPRSSSYYRITERVTAPDNTEIEFDSGAELHWSATTANGTSFLGDATRPGIEVMGDNFSVRGYGKITGPSSASYVLNEAAIFSKGISTSIRRSGFDVREVEIYNWGSYGILTQFVDDVSVLDSLVHGVGYAGISILSGTKGQIQRNKVYGITPGTSSNAYGITLTHDSTDYNLDPFAASNGRLAANPFCIDWDVCFNEVYDIPLWVGIDAHGGYEVRFHHNAVYNTLLGISLAGGSGDAANYAGENNSVEFNSVTTLKRDGTATTVTGGEAASITINGGSVVQHRNVVVVGNRMYGGGGTVSWTYNISASYCRSAVISGNVLTNWKGAGVYLANSDGVAANNLFDQVSSQPSSRCIYIDDPSYAWVISGNKHRPESGTVAAEGIRVSAGNTARHTIIGNDFVSAVDPYAGNLVNQTQGNSDSTPLITLSGTPTTIDASATGNAQRVVVSLNTSGPTTITDITSAKMGQIFNLQNPNATNVTFDRSNAALAGGANAVLGQYDTLVLLCVSTSGIKFVELSRSANS